MPNSEITVFYCTYSTYTVNSATLSPEVLQCSVAALMGVGVSTHIMSLFLLALTSTPVMQRLRKTPVGNSVNINLFNVSGF